MPDDSSRSVSSADRLILQSSLRTQMRSGRLARTERERSTETLDAREPDELFAPVTPKPTPSHD